MRFVRSLGSVILFLTLVIFCGVPAFPQDAPDVAMGMNPQPTYHSNDFDFIDTATGRLNFHIPLVVDHSQRGKLNFTYSLTFTSTGTWNLIYDSRNVPRIEPPKYGVSSAAFVTDGLLGAPIGESYRDASGQTNLALSVPEGAWGAGPLHPLGDVETIDGSGIFSSYNTNRNQLVAVNRQGVQFHYPTGWPWPASIEDANGNVIAFSGSGSTFTMTDTLGRTWTTTYNSPDVSGCPFGGPVAPTTSTIWTIPGPANVSNGLRTFKLCYSPYGIITHFNAGVQYSAGQGLTTGVVLPNGTTGRFDYDNNSYGDLIAVYPPTGGSISYTWTTSDASCSNYGFGTRTVASRTVSDGTNSHKWTYVWTNRSTASTYTATDPLGNDTVYTATFCSGVVNQIQYYSGSATSGNLLKTVAKSYRSLPDPYPTDVTDWWVPSPALLTSTTTTWPNGQQSQVQLAYDSGFTFTDTNHDHNGPRTYTSSYGLVTAESHNDYGNGAPGPVLSTMNTNYLALSNSSYVTANILDLPSAVITTAGNGNKCAETDYGYDAPAQIVPSGITKQHVSAPSSVRGSLTSITRQLYSNPCQSANPAGTSLTTTRYVYDTGMLQKSVDPRGNPATYAYSSTYYGAYPTSITNALNQSGTYGYDFNTGLLTSSKDPNNQPTSFIYDNMLRPVSASYPDGGL